MPVRCAPVQVGSQGFLADGLVCQCQPELTRLKRHALIGVLSTQQHVLGGGGRGRGRGSGREEGGADITFQIRHRYMYDTTDMSITMATNTLN